MKTIDRRYIYLILLVSVSVLLVFPLGLKMLPSKSVRQVYELVDSLKPNTPVIISFDYDPSTKPELHPMAKALMYHIFQKKGRVAAIALWPQGASLAQQTFEDLQKENENLTYGKDFVNLGYKSGGIVTIQAMAKNFRSVFPTDVNGKSIAELPMLNGVKDISPFGFVLSLSAGDPGLKQYIMVAHDQYNIPTAGGTTAVSAPGFFPYINEQKQLTGLLSGVKGAAEYELLLNRLGTATSQMDALSVAHLIIIIFIILGNITFFINKKRGA